MTLKIRSVAGKREIRICLSGQLRSEHLDQLKSEVERGGPGVTLDLEEQWGALQCRSGSARQRAD
jgi:hypothetical protein